MEGIVLHAFEGEPPFGEDSLQRIAQLKAVYGMDYGIEESHGLVDRVPDREGE